MKLVKPVPVPKGTGFTEGDQLRRDLPDRFRLRASPPTAVPTIPVMAGIAIAAALCPLARAIHRTAPIPGRATNTTAQFGPSPGSSGPLTCFFRASVVTLVTASRCSLRSGPCLGHLGGRDRLGGPGGCDPPGARLDPDLRAIGHVRRTVMARSYGSAPFNGVAWRRT